MLLKELKTTDFNQEKKYTFVLPMGATEQHGPFLPIGTDTYCQNAMLEKAIKECPEAIFLPTLEITCSKEHIGFPGTVWVEKETLMLMLRDISMSLKDYASNIIFISWHGGNLGTIDRFIEKYTAELGSVKLHYITLDPEPVLQKTRELINGPVDDHAGNTETSMVLSIDEGLVTVPPANYPKKDIGYDWDDKHPLKDFSKDGIHDRHPKWVVDKEQGRLLIGWSAEHLKNEIQRIMQ